MKPLHVNNEAGIKDPERMAVGPERAENLRESARQKGEADANVGLIVGIGLLVYAVWVLVNRFF